VLNSLQFLRKLMIFCSSNEAPSYAEARTK
jgi:hypothetical protein